VFAKLLRSWRVVLLAWAVLLAPQVSMLHALSHSVPGTAHRSSDGDGDARKHAPAKVCDNCLALAQLGAALPASFHWAALATSQPSHRAPAAIVATPRAESAYEARAPPLELT
jgi:DUF2946 family protein